MSESFLPPVLVELGGTADKFLKTLTKAIAGLDRFSAAAKAAGVAAEQAFATIEASAAPLAAMAESTAAAKTEMQGLARASNAVSKATDKAAIATDAGMNSIAAAAERMAAAVDSATAAAGTGIAGLGAEARATATGLRTTSTESVVAGENMARAGTRAEGMGSKLLGLGPIFDKVKKWGTLGLAAVGIAAVILATHFQTEMTRISTAAGAPIAQVEAMRSEVLKTATSVGESGTKMAEALYHPVSAGLDLKTSLQAVKYAAEEAQISGASLDDTTYSLSSVMKAFNFSAKDAGPTMAQLNAIVGQGDVRFQDFNASVKNWAPTAAQMGISVTSMGSGLAYLTDRGNSAEVAATRLTMGISMMTTPSSKATKMLVAMGAASTDVHASSAAMESAMKKAGITQNRLAADLKKPDGLYVALTDLKTSLEKAGVSGTEADSVLSKIFGGGRSDKAIMSLMQNLGGVKTKFEDIQKASNMKNFDAAWQKTTKTLRYQFDQIKAGAENLGIRIGDSLIPQVSKFISLLENRGAPAVKSISSAFSGITAGFTGSAEKVQPGKVVTTAGGQQHGGATTAPSLTGWQKLGEAIRDVTKDARTFGTDVAQSVSNLGHALGPVGAQLGVGFVGALKLAGSILATVVGPALQSFTGFLDRNRGMVKIFADVILGGLALKLGVIGGIKAATGITTLATKILAFPMAQVSAIKDAFGGLRTAAVKLGETGGKIWSGISTGASGAAGAMSKAASAAKSMGGKIAEAAKAGASTAWSGLAEGAKAAGRGLKLAAEAALDFSRKAVVATASALRQAASFVIEKTAALASAVAEKAMAAAEWLLNVAMDANPIMLVVLAIAAVVAALVYAYMHFAWFRTGVQAAFHAISDAVMFVVNFVKAHWLPILALITGPIGLAVILVIKYWSQIHSAIMTAVNAVVGFVKGHWPLLLAILTGPIGIAVLLITRYWGKISSAFSSAYHAVVSTGRSLVGWVAGLPGMILGAVASLGGKLVSWASSAFGRAKSAAIAKAIDLNAWMGGLPGRILSALGNVGSLLYSAGQHIMTGLWNGISSMGSTIAGKIGGLVKSVVPGPVLKVLGINSPSKVFHDIGLGVTEGLVNGLTASMPQAAQASVAMAQTTADSFSAELGINSPSKVFRQLGIYINEGLVDGLTSSTASVKAATRRIESLLIQTKNKVTDLLSSSAAQGKKGAGLRGWVADQEKTISRLQAYTAREDKELRKLAANRDAVAGRLKSAQKKLSDLQKAWASEKSSVASSITQGVSLITTSPQDGAALTGQDVLNNLKDQAAKVAAFSAQLQALKKKGLSASLIEQIASAGVDQGGATAAALAAASSDTIKQVNETQKGITTSANATGKVVADAMYGAGIKSAQGLVKGLQSQEKAIDAQMLKIAKSMEKAIKSALGIRSPSTVMAKLGDHTARGYAMGIDRSAKHAVIAARGMAMAVRQGASMGGGLTGAVGGTSAVAAPPVVNVYLTVQGTVTSERNLVEAVRTGLLRGGLRNNNVGLVPKR